MTTTTTTKQSITKAVKDYQETLDQAEEQFLSDMEELLPTFIEDNGTMQDFMKITGLPQTRVYKILKDLDLKFPRRGRTSPYSTKEREKIARKVFKQGENITKTAAAFDLNENQVRAYGKEFGYYKPKTRNRRNTSGKLKVADTAHNKTEQEQDENPFAEELEDEPAA